MSDPMQDLPDPGRIWLRRNSIEIDPPFRIWQSETIAKIIDYVLALIAILATLLLLRAFLNIIFQYDPTCGCVEIGDFRPYKPGLLSLILLFFMWSTWVLFLPLIRRYEFKDFEAEKNQFEEQYLHTDPDDQDHVGLDPSIDLKDKLQPLLGLKYHHQYAVSALILVPLLIVIMIIDDFNAARLYGQQPDISRIKVEFLVETTVTVLIIFLLFYTIAIIILDALYRRRQFLDLRQELKDVLDRNANQLTQVISTDTTLTSEQKNELRQKRDAFRRYENNLPDSLRKGLNKPAIIIPFLPLLSPLISGLLFPVF